MLFRSQFKNNKYEKVFFDIEQKISAADYLNAYLVVFLEGKQNELKKSILDGDDPESIQADLQILNTQIAEMGKLVPGLPPYKPGQTDVDAFNDSTTMAAIQSYFSSVKMHTRDIVGSSRIEKELVNEALIEQLGSVKAYTRFRDKYQNKSLNDLVLNQNVVQKVDEKNGRLIRKHKPAYMKPTSRFGRAYLYAPNKQIGGLELDTLLYNVVAIWLYTLFLYFTLRTDLLRKAITFSERRKLTRKQAS